MAMKKVISIILAAVMLLCTATVAGAAAHTLDIKAMIDPIEGKILISGKTSAGSDSRISAVVTNSADKIVYADECVSASDGAFKISINANSLPEDSYTATFRAKNTETAKYNFTLPIPEGNAVKINAVVEGNSFFLIENNAPEEENSTVTFKIKNATVALGKLNTDDYEITGLPSGYSVDVRAISADTVTARLLGTGEIKEVKELTLRFKSTIISSGKANTSSDVIEGIKIYPEEISKKVNYNLSGDQIRMRDAKNISDSANSVELEILLRPLLKSGALKQDEDFTFTKPSALTGLKCEVSANKSTNKIRVKFSGYTTDDLKKDVSITDFVIKSGVVLGASQDSDPFSITVIAATTGAGGSSGGGSSGGGSGTSSGGSFVGSGNNGFPHEMDYTGPKDTSSDIDPVIPALSVDFADCAGHWAEDNIKTLAGAGIISGTGAGRFEPNRKITRAEFVTLIVKAFGFSETAIENPYGDVLSDSWYGANVLKALNAGIIAKDTVFRPNDPIKREEMVKIIADAWLTENEKPEWISVSSFADKSAIDSWANDYVDLGVTLGFVMGDDHNRFNPMNSTTRAEAASVIYRVLYLN